MIQKRYEFMGRNGRTWSEWFNCCSDDTQLERLKREEKYQYGTKYKNEYRIV